MLKLVCMVLLISNYAIAAQTNSYHEVIQNVYSDSFVTYNNLCQETKNLPKCKEFAIEYTKAFEREVIVYLNENINKENITNIDTLQRSKQNIDVSLYRYKELSNLSAYVIILDQEILNKYSSFLVEAKNYDTENNIMLNFTDLFGDANYAARLCARYIEKEFKQYNSNILPIIIAVTEYSPQSYIISKKGLLFFLPKELNPSVTTKLIHSEIPIEKLMQAKPNLNYWKVQP